MIEITLQNITPRFSQEVELSGVTYALQFEWNDRDQSWAFGVSDVDGVVLAQGLPVRVGFPLLARIRVAGLPPGSIEAIDTSGRGIEAGFADLGARVVLVYSTPDELPSAWKV
jgi:hypothetical protein